jgi:hypothetical protein
METDRRSAAYDRIEIAESAWLVCGLLWVVAGALAIVLLPSLPGWVDFSWS